jgi:cbb3-type cytochrome oxidase maturation protein
MLELTLGQFAVAMCVSLAGLCVFIWAALSGLFHDVEGIAERVYRAEVDDEQR